MSYGCRDVQNCKRMQPKCHMSVLKDLSPSICSGERFLHFMSSSFDIFAFSMRFTSGNLSKLLLVSPFLILPPLLLTSLLKSPLLKLNLDTSPVLPLLILLPSPPPGRLLLSVGYSSSIFNSNPRSTNLMSFPF